MTQKDGPTARIPRYTIEQQTGTIYFRLVEDSNGAWVTWANHDALVSKLEARIIHAEAAFDTPEARLLLQSAQRYGRCIEPTICVSYPVHLRCRGCLLAALHAIVTKADK